MQNLNYNLTAKTKLFTIFIIFFTFISFFLLLFLQTKNDGSVDKLSDKSEILKIISLPHIAIYDGEKVLEIRPEANIYDLIGEDGELQSKSKMSFVY